MSNGIDNVSTIRFFCFLDVSKCCIELDPMHNICIGTNFPSRKAYILEHEWASQYMGFGNLIWGSIGIVIMERPYCSESYKICHK